MMSNNKILYILLLVGISYILPSCSDKEENKNIIDRDTMVQILSDMEMAKATIIISDMNKKPDKKQLFEHIYINHHTTSQTFDNSLLYYSKKPKEMEQIYNDVITVLSQKQASLQ